MERSSHFLQAYTLLNLHVIHASEAEQRANQDTPTVTPRRKFKIYSPLPTDSPANHRTSSSSTVLPNGARTINTPPDTADVTNTSSFEQSFTALQLLRIMSKLVEPGVVSLPYFLLCREIGVQAVDDLVRGRILELRWTETVTQEGGATNTNEVVVSDSSTGAQSGGGGGVMNTANEPRRSDPEYASTINTTTLGYDIGFGSDIELESESEDEISGHTNLSPNFITGATLRNSTMRHPVPPSVPRPPRVSRPGHRRENSNTSVNSNFNSVSATGLGPGPSASSTGLGGMGVNTIVRGPILLPMTPIMRFAMREVLKEYRGPGPSSGYSGNEGERERASSYTSLSDVEEY